MVENIKQFNEILGSFLIQLSPMIGSTYSSQFENIIKYNSLLPLEQFCCYALPLKDKILNKDESYFTNPDNIKDTISNEDSNTINEILKLKDIYKNLNEDSKSNVWDIFQALLYLSIEYIAYKYKK